MSMTVAASGTEFEHTDATRAKGPPVWLDMDQEQLDAAYEQSNYAPNQAHVLARRAINSAFARTVLGEPLRRAYGTANIEQLDIYKTSHDNAPVNVFIHGGTWRNGRAIDFADLAQLFVNAGAHFIILDFSSLNDVGGNLMVLAHQVRRAVAWVYRNAASFGGDPDQIYVSGNSSGGHLAGCVVTTDWPGEFDSPKDLVKGGLLTSGMYDLRPVRLSSRSQYVMFTDEIEEKLSPQRHLDRLHCPIIVSYGSLETPEFRRQARDFAAAVRALAKPVTLLTGEGYNHFEMLETLATPYGLLGRAALAQMKLLQSLA
jgi:arylformamidase